MNFEKVIELLGIRTVGKFLKSFTVYFENNIYICMCIYMYYIYIHI